MFTIPEGISAADFLSQPVVHWDADRTIFKRIVCGIGFAYDFEKVLKRFGSAADKFRDRVEGIYRGYVPGNISEIDVTNTQHVRISAQIEAEVGGIYQNRVLNLVYFSDIASGEPLCNSDGVVHLLNEKIYKSALPFLDEQGEVLFVVPTFNLNADSSKKLSPEEIIGVTVLRGMTTQNPESSSPPSRQ